MRRKEPKYRQMIRSARKNLNGDVVSRQRIGHEIMRRARRLGITRERMAAIVEDAPSQMSRLMNQHFGEFALDRMVGYLKRLGCGVTITIAHPKKRTLRGRVRIVSTERR